MEGLPRLEREPKSDPNRIAVRPLIIEGKLHGGQLRHLGVVLHGLIFLRGEARRFVGDGVVAVVLRQAAPGGVQQVHRPLQGDKDGDAHNQGQDGDGGAAPAALQIKPGIKRLKIADFFSFPAPALDFHLPARHRDGGGYPRCVPCRRQGGNHGKDQRNGGAGQQEQALARAVFLDQAA